MTTPTVATIGLPRQVFFDANGNPAVGGRVTTYLAGTTTLAPTYADASGTVANPNPIVLDGRGECVIWYDVSLSYKLAPVTANGTALPVQDNVSAPHTSGTTTASLPLSGGTLTGALQLAADAAGPLQPVTLEQFTTSLATKVSTSTLASYVQITDAPLFAGTSPRVGVNNTAAPADSKVWDWICGADGTLQLRMVNDANTAANAPFSVTRTGVTATTIAVTANAITANGAARINGQLAVVNDIGSSYGGQMTIVNQTTGHGPTFRVNPSNDMELINASYATQNAALIDATGDWVVRGLLKANALSGGTPGIGLGRLFVQAMSAGIPADIAEGDIVLQY